MNHGVPLVVGIDKDGSNQLLFHFVMVAKSPRRGEFCSQCRSVSSAACIELQRRAFQRAKKLSVGDNHALRSFNALQLPKTPQ